ncbi:MAG: GH3 auxin-responsive promoter family protein [Bacteroidota bacterium]
MQIINSLVNWLNVKRMYQIEMFKTHPVDVQREQLFKLINKAEDTEWGKKYDYPSIESIRDFQERVPVNRYEDMKPYIERLLQGESDLLWPGTIRWFAKSSGTTSDKSKYIPVSKESLENCHFRGGKDTLAIYFSNNPDSKLYSGKGLTLGGSQQINRINNQSFYGDLSAILIDNAPFWTHFVKTPRQDIALMAEWEEKLEKITETTIKENITNINGVPSWMLVLLKHVLKKTGKNNILEVWPNLELFVHGGVSFGPYKEHFRKLLPSDNVHYMEAYNASEGFFAIQDSPSQKDMLLMLDYGVFFEFIPMDELEKEHPKALTLDGVETDKNYAIVISTNGGLWRYMIGDTIQFTNLYPHKIKITGRTKHFINAFGEEVIIDNAEDALDSACEKTGAMVKEYTAAPVYMGTESKGKHEWIIEFEKKPDHLEHFTKCLDETLQSINSDYEAKRYKDITLEAPIVHKAKPGLFYQWMKKRGKLGGQNKVPRLSNDRKYIDDLLELNRQISA